MKLRRVIAVMVLAMVMAVGMSGTAWAGSGLLGYSVKSGDTLWLLANRYGTSVAEIKQVNNLSRDSLSVGQYLRIPVKTTDQGIRYHVQAGDTLYLISQRHNVSVSNIKSASRISSDWLSIGQRLVVPFERMHIVERGESLYRLAGMYGVSVDDIKRANGLNTEELWIGQILAIPGSTVKAPSVESSVLHRVKTGETLSGIAIQYGTTVNAIYETNRLNSWILMPGQPLYIPVGKSEAVYVEGPKGTQVSGYGEFLDWEWARWVFNVGSTAVIEDLQTGVKFNITYMGGSNHADCEPLTYQDTEAIRRLFGGWTWASRPVLVHTNGRVLAASMSAMPHDVQTISNNGFDGHFDLYFWNSTTHFSNELRDHHQANVLKAAGR